MILNILVPQTSQTALIAFLPFFIVTDSWFFPSLFALHFTQYIFIASPPFGPVALWTLCYRIHLRSHEAAALAFFLANYQTKYITTSEARMIEAKIKLFRMSFFTKPKSVSLAVKLAILFFETFFEASLG